MAGVNVNPIHFKPTWFFVRMPDESDEIKDAFGGGCLSLSDAEMIVTRVALSAFGSVCQIGDERMRSIARVVDSVSEKLKAVLAIELSEDEPDSTPT